MQHRACVNVTVSVDVVERGRGRERVEREGERGERGRERRERGRERRERGRECRTRQTLRFISSLCSLSLFLSAQCPLGKCLGIGRRKENTERETEREMVVKAKHKPGKIIFSKNGSATVKKITYYNCSYISNIFALLLKSLPLGSISQHTRTQRLPYPSYK